MKKIVALAIVFTAGAIAGTSYGWFSGFRDGQIQTASMGLAIHRKYSEMRAERAIEKVDRLADATAIAIASEATRSQSFSPIAPLNNARIDEVLLNTYVLWEIDHPDGRKIGIPEWDGRVAEILKKQGVTLEELVQREKDRRARNKERNEK
jgi:hypothetical protein